MPTHLTKDSKLVHGGFGRCMFVDRQCGPGCQGFVAAENRCGLILGINYVLRCLTGIVHAAGYNMPGLPQIPPREPESGGE